MNILALDCSTGRLSAAVKNRESQIFTMQAEAGNSHSSLLMPAVEYLTETARINPSELDLIISGSGPGAFTGLRIAMSTAKALAMGADCPFVGISSLEMMALPCRFFDGLVMPVIDARRSRVYTALFHKGKRLLDDSDIDPEEILKKHTDQPILVTGKDGSIIKNCPSALAGNISYTESYYGTWAEALIELGLHRFNTLGADPDNSGPRYIRKSDAELQAMERKKNE